MRLLFHLGLLFLTFSAYSQNIRTLNGYISSKKTGEKLIGATIYDTVHKVGTTTNEYGFYSLSIPNEATVLRITNFGFDPYFLDATLQKNDNGIYTDTKVPAFIKEKDKCVINVSGLDKINKPQVDLDAEEIPYKTEYIR